MIARQIPDDDSAVEIRSVGSKDLDRITEIEERAYSVPWSRATFRSLLFRTDTDMLCAEIDGQLVGYAICWFVLDQGELGNLAVAEPWRGRGVGARLAESIIERARQRRIKEVFLEVRRSNLTAQRLYRRMGFREIGVRRNYYVQPTEDALVMRCLALQP
jgi:ribosomal-protein-alanine acetyltransferase